MTSTPVKDVGSVLSSLTATVGSNVKTVAGNGFQTVLSGQTDRETADNCTKNAQADKTQTAVKKTPGDSLKAKDAHRARVAEKESAKGGEALQENSDEIPAEKLEETAEVLGTAAAELLQQIADTFGISPEELANAMQELGMESLDVLGQGKLGELLLKLGGAEDVYALVTNGELYEKYQELMESLDTLLQDAGEELEINPEQLQAALQQEEPAQDEIPEIPVEVIQEAEDIEQEKPVRQEDAENREIQGTERTLEADQTQTVAEAVESQPTGEKGSQTQAEAGKKQGDSERDGRENLFTQNFRTDQFQTQFSTQVQQPAASDVWSTDTQDIMRQIMDYMRIQVRPEATNLEMQLHPESLGTLHIQVASRGGVLTANFITQNEAVKAALESQMVQLRENFEQQGVKVEAIEVTVQSHAFERNLEQGRGQNSEQGQPAKKTRTRRINLDDSLEIENLEEEDTLAAEMMAASGSQVDYTV